MKKKNIAMMMAGVTVASAVAPAFAAQDLDTTQRIAVNVNDVKELESKLREMLNVKFTEVKGNGTEKVEERVYNIKVNGEDTEIVNASDVVNKINENGKIVLNIVDKGHKTVGKNVVNYKVEQYKTTDEILSAAKLAKLEAKAIATDTVEVKLTADAKEVVTVKVGDNKLDFTQAEKNNGKLTGFKALFTDIENTVYEITLSKVETIDAKELFDGIRLTEEGTKLFEAVTSGSTVTIESATNEDTVDPGFSLGAFNVVVKEDGKIVKTIRISSEDAQLVEDLKAVLCKVKSAVNLVAGETRFTTAVEVSKQLVAEGQTANAVVLVGEDAIVDGLAAAPLAKKEGAPILLTKKDDLTAETEKEMLRVLGDNVAGKTVYLVGGEARISKELEAKITKLGVKVERLAGETRFETSLKIAEKVTTKATLNTNNTTFVVGGNGEADAMSISAYAAQIEAPIVVVDKNEVSEEAMEFLDNTNVEIIGGTGVVSAEVEAQLKEIDKDGKIVRLAGETRQGTNAKVINAKYNNPNTAFIAKDGYVGGNGKLIDALSAAPLAARDNAPIVLTSNELTVEQTEAIELRLTGVKKLVQIGKGIADAAIKSIMETINF